MLNNKPQPIGISEFISRIKQELLEEYNQDKPLLLISELELEITFSVERNMQGGVDFVVIESDVNKTMTNIQTLKMKLEPIVLPVDLRDKLSPEEKENAREQLIRSFRPKVK